MNLRPLITLAFIGISLLKSTAQISDPIKDFLFSRDENKDLYLPDLKTLYVVKLDINNNGRPATLISMNSYGSRDGNFWKIYVPVGGSYYKADDKSACVYFKASKFFVGNVPGFGYGLLAYLPSGELDLFQVVDGKILKRKVVTLDRNQPEAEKTFEQYFGKAPNWKSLKDHPVQEESISDLKGKGYDVKAAVSAAEAAN